MLKIWLRLFFKVLSFWMWNSNFARKYSLQLHLYRTAVNSRSDEAFSNWRKCVHYRSPWRKVWQILNILSPKQTGFESFGWKGKWMRNYFPWRPAKAAKYCGTHYPEQVGNEKLMKLKFSWMRKPAEKILIEAWALRISFCKMWLAFSFAHPTSLYSWNISVFNATMQYLTSGAQEVCESRGGRPGLPSLISPRFLWT